MADPGPGSLPQVEQTLEQKRSGALPAQPPPPAPTATQVRDAIPDTSSATAEPAAQGVTAVPEDFYDGGKSRAADDARKAKAADADLDALLKLGASTSDQAAEREGRIAAEYDDRAELLRIEQEVVELRAAEARERIAKRVTGADLEPSSGPRDTRPDEAWSLIAPATFHGAPITAAEAAKAFREQAASAGGTGGGQDARDAAEGGADDDDGFVGLDDWT